MGQRTYPFDIQTLLKDAGAVTANGPAQVSAVNQILDMGNARIDTIVVIDVASLNIATADENYTIILQGSNSATFASGIQNLATASFGSTVVRPGGAGDSLVGRYEMMGTTEQADVTYRYLRLYTVVAGTAPSINYTAFITELPEA